MPLTDLRVIEVGQAVAGPTAGMILADLGAEVIKVERPGTGDLMRENLSTDSTIGDFEFLNRGKRSVEIDLKDEEGRKQFNQLLSDADVLLENLSPGAFDRLGLSFTELANEHENLIIASIKGYGHGPFEDRLATDYPIEVGTGMTYMTGLENQPLRVGFSVIDMFSGTFAALGILATYVNLPLAPEQRILTTGMYETGSFIMGQSIAYAAKTGTNPKPKNEKGFKWAVYNSFATRDDKQVFIGITSDPQWERFVDEFDLESLKDPDLTTREGRATREAELREVIQDEVQKYDAETIIERLNAIRVPCAHYRKPLDVLDNPHLNETNKFLTGLYRSSAIEVLPKEMIPSDGIRLPMLPIEGGLFRYETERNIPDLGEDTESLLGEKRDTATE